MVSEAERGRYAWAILKGASRGAALSLGVMLVVDADAAGALAGLPALGLSHPPAISCMIMTLALVSGLLELERQRRRVVAKYGMEGAR